MNEEFYIGWEAWSPAGHARATRRLVSILSGLVMIAGLGLAVSQRLIGVASFEWGRVNEFKGVLHVDPYPHLVLPRNPANIASGLIAAPLVAPFKFGVRRDDVAGFDGQPVALRATRIHRDGLLMLELEPGSMALDLTGSTPPIRASEPVVLGRHTFRGEIVDSKCWMGVMNPGVLTPHRACAVRCISGGVPPMLLVRREGAAPLNFLLVFPGDQPVNDHVLNLVAEPVEITGQIVRHGELLTLRADPAAYRRIGGDPDK